MPNTTRDILVLQHGNIPSPIWEFLHIIPRGKLVYTGVINSDNTLATDQKTHPYYDAEDDEECLNIAKNNGWTAVCDELHRLQWSGLIIADGASLLSGGAFFRDDPNLRKTPIILCGAEPERFRQFFEEKFQVCPNIVHCTGKGWNAFTLAPLVLAYDAAKKTGTALTPTVFKTALEKKTAELAELCKAPCPAPEEPFRQARKWQHALSLARSWKNASLPMFHHDKLYRYRTITHKKTAFAKALKRLTA